MILFSKIIWINYKKNKNGPVVFYGGWYIYYICIMKTCGQIGIGWSNRIVFVVSNIMLELRHFQVQAIMLNYTWLNYPLLNYEVNKMNAWYYE